MNKESFKSNLRELSSKLLFRKKSAGFVRRHQRYEVNFASNILMQGRTVPIPGIINEISLGGVRMRPATTYLLQREDEVASVQIGEVYYPCQIKNTGPDGYGIRLSRQIDEDLVDEIVREFGTKAAAA
ncbi:MAG: PilZ domain-containing protein [Pseudomonadota bacterium]